MPNDAIFVRAKMVAADGLVVGGLTPLTTLDYPDHLSCVVFTQGCPLRCGYCHNPHLIANEAQEKAPSWRYVRDFLERRQGLLQAVVFSGGEPTQQAALLPAVQEVAALSFQVALHTAGIYPKRLAQLLPYLSWVGLDIKASPDRYPQVVGRPRLAPKVQQSLELLAAAQLPFEVRVTLHPFDFDQQHLEALLTWLGDYSLGQVVLQLARPGPCLDPRYAELDQPFPRPLLEAVISRYQSQFKQLLLRG